MPSPASQPRACGFRAQSGTAHSRNAPPAPNSTARRAGSGAPVRCRSTRRHQSPAPASAPTTPPPHGYRATSPRAPAGLRPPRCGCSMRSGCLRSIRNIPAQYALAHAPAHTAAPRAGSHRAAPAPLRRSPHPLHAAAPARATHRCSPARESLGCAHGAWPDRHLESRPPPAVASPDAAVRAPPSRQPRLPPPAAPVAHDRPGRRPGHARRLQPPGAPTSAPRSGHP